jgi:hypothetical protein
MAAAQYEELGDYLIRIGLSWLFLTFCHSSRSAASWPPCRRSSL